MKPASASARIGSPEQIPKKNSVQFRKGNGVITPPTEDTKKSPSRQRKEFPGLPSHPPRDPGELGSSSTVMALPSSQLPLCKRLNIRHFLALACCYIFLQSMVVTGLVSAVITSVERQFSFSSSQTGVLLSTYDIPVCILVVPISYYGGRASIPRVLGVGVGVLALGAFVWTVPFLRSGTYTPPANAGDLCSGHGAACGGGADMRSYARFVMAQVLVGIGATPLHPLAVAYLDANAPVAHLPMYMAAFQATGAIGPALGYLAAGTALGTWVDGDAKKPPGMTIDSASWVGQWWLPFLLVAALGLVVAALFPFFPRSLVEAGGLGDVAGAPKDRHGGAVSGGRRGGGAEAVVAEADVVVSTKAGAELQEQQQQQQQQQQQPQVNVGYLSLSNTMVRVMKSPSIMWNMAGQAAEGAVVSSFAAFLPKMFESQYGLTAGSASLLTGAIVVPGFAGGIFLGGWLVERWKLDVAQTAAFCYQIAGVALVFMCAFFTGCSSPKIAGINEPLGFAWADKSALHGCEHGAQEGGGGCLTAACNAGCGCSVPAYEPVCGSDSVTYLSPCVAGCHALLNGDAKSFVDCSCVPNATGLSAALASVSLNGTAKAGMCTNADGNCYTQMLVFCVLLLFAMFVTAMNNTPATYSQMKTAERADRPTVLGVNNIVYRILGAIPGPIVFGGMLDSSCALFKVSW